MKFLISTIAIIILSFVASLYFPWWVISIVAFAISFIIPLKAGISFVSGFMALFILWASIAFWISSSNENILAHKISMIILKQDSPVLLIIITGIVGGLVSGLAALSGSYLRNLIYTTRRKIEVI